MIKDKGQFDQLYSEEQVQFNNIYDKSKSKFKPQASSLHQIVKDGERLSQINKNLYKNAEKGDNIKKRKSQNETQGNTLDSKMQSYRQRSKMRFNVNQIENRNEELRSQEKLTIQIAECETSMQNIDKNNKNNDQLIIKQKKPREKTNQSIKKDKEIVLNKQKNKLDQLNKAYGAGKKILPKNIGQNEKGNGNQTKERAARLQKLQRAKQILSGKLSTVWIYAISTKIDPQIHNRIYAVYKGLVDDSNIVPFVKNAWEIQPFLQLPNTYFKIVSNIANMEGALRYKINVKVVQYYIYNDLGEDGISLALEYKSWSKKVKGIFPSLQKIVEKTQEQIEDTIQIYKMNNGFQANVKQNKFPSFLKLTGKDKTEATLYRGNLYGAIKLQQQDKKLNYEYFLMLVREKYGKIDKQLQNIKDYIKIKHLKVIKTLGQAEQIIKFYVRQSFYYQIVNSMLRTLKTTEEFKPCILPFNQTYHSIRLYYQSFLKEHNRVMPAMTLYRGAKLKKSDYIGLKEGDFIQMFGFMSTSKSKESAQKFTDKDGYMFVIHIKQRRIVQKYDKYDHGFVDINKYNLAGQFQKEEQVLFNALNIYKVISIDPDSQRNIMIHLQYGSIFSILEKPKINLTLDQKDVLINYQYCTKLMGDIDDQGDVHLLANQFDEAKDFYVDKINKDNKNANNYYKLANVQKECGQIDEAQKNGMKSLQMMTQNLNLLDKETCLKVFSIHSKNAEINMQKEDYLNADEQLTKGIQLLDDSDFFNKAKKIRERGQIKFKKGEIKDSEKDFQNSERIFSQIEKKSEDKRWQLKKKYLFSFLTLWCNEMTNQQLQWQKQLQLTKIQQMQRQISEMKDLIEDELIKVNKSLKDVAIYAEDKQKYEYCVKKGRAYLLNIQSRQTNDPSVKARLKVMEATIQDYLELAQSQILLMDAIALVESQTPFDPAVGQYSLILAKLQKKQLQKYTNPQVSMKLSKDKKTVYNKTDHNNTFNKCKTNFAKAINILLYNNKARDSPEVITLRNQLGDLQFGENNYTNAEEIIRQIKADASHVEHTEISKASLLLGKIAFSRGQLKNSFKIFQESDNLLQKVLIKSRQNPKYILLYERSDIYFEIVYYKSKVYHRQLQHDMSLKQLTLLQKKLDEKMDGYQSHNLLASVYEQIGEVKAHSGQKEFISYFQKAIDLRKKQMGYYNIFNAISYCNYSKYLIMVNQIGKAQQELTQATEIFSCMSNDHPINWIINFSNGIFREMKEQYTEASLFFKKSLEMAKEKFDSSHITIKKVRLKIAKIMLKLGDIDESFRQLQQLQEQMQQGIRESQLKTNVLDEIDDQKITLEKIILSELKAVIQKEENNVRFTQIQAQKYKKKYEDLRRTFRLQGFEKE